jgi:hypothetical protein
MKAPATVNAELGDKALRLFEENRAMLHRDGCAAFVAGDTATYLVRAFSDGLSCSCPAGREITNHREGGSPRCSHVVAAMIAWSERRRP